MREVDRPLDERISVLDRPRSDSDMPPDVSKMIETAPAEPASLRLALVDGERHVYIGRCDDDGLFLLFRDAQGGGASGGPRSVLVDHGAMVMWTSNDNRFAVSGVVADIVTSVRVGDVQAALGNNAFAVVVARGLTDTIIVSTPEGEREVAMPPLHL